MSDPLALRVLVVIPAWNEEQTLPAVLAELASTQPGLDAVVVNDGSTDATSAVARAAGTRVIDLPINLGVGGAMRAGFRYALRSGYDAAVQLDADGQHDPRAINDLAAVMADEGADLVIGARFAGTGTYTARGPRRWAMRLLSRVLSRLTGTKLTDTTSGLKMVGPRALRLFAADYPAEYLGDTIEALVSAHRAGLVIKQTGVEMRERSGGTPSQRPWKAGIFLLRAILALVVAVSRPRSKPVSA